jgi:protein TonB
MEKKKTNRANLENKKMIFSEIGLIVALAVSLLAFEWRTYDKLLFEKPVSNWTEIEEILPVNTEQKKLPPPPTVAKPVIIFNIVEEPVELPDDLPIFDAGIDETDAIPDYIPLPEEVSDAAEDSVYNTSSIEIQPEFPGGEAALYKFLADNIKYPRMAVESGIQGTVYIGFVVEKNGNLSNISVLRNPNELLTNEALRVVTSMPDWSPGKQGGRPVRVSFSLPVKFRLQ